MLDHQRLAVFLSHVGSGDVTSADLSVASSLTSRSRSPEALSQIQARQQDLARLEASVSHLQQLFSEVAALLDTQVSVGGSKPRPSVPRERLMVRFWSGPPVHVTRVSPSARES